MVPFIVVCMYALRIHRYVFMYPFIGLWVFAVLVHRLVSSYDRGMVGYLALSLVAVAGEAALACTAISTV